MSMESIQKLAKEMESESKAMKADLFKMCWYMRGSMSLTEAYNTDEEDRKLIAALIESNLETTKETQWPFF